MSFTPRRRDINFWTIKSLSISFLDRLMLNLAIATQCQSTDYTLARDPFSAISHYYLSSSSFHENWGAIFLRVDVVFYDIPAITIDAHVLFSLLKLSCLWWCRWKEQVRQCNSNFKFFFSKRALKRILPSDWFLAQSVFSYLCPRAR